MLPKAVAVVGTNASGKSALGVELALRYGGEIVSADSRQVYRRMDLGSGKITPGEMRGVPHHLINVCEPGDFFSMGDFQRLAYEAIDGILGRGRLPFMVGGTGLYVTAVTKGYRLTGTMPDLAYRDELRGLETPELYRRLLEIEPDVEVDPRNRNRVMRYLEKHHDGAAGKEEPEPRYDFLKLGVTWERRVLVERIGERLDRRFAQGMIDEVAALLKEGVEPIFLDRLGLEYKFICCYLTGRIATFDELREKLFIAIRQFAKRQMTWFRKDPEIRWLDMTGDPAGEACRLIDAFLAGGRTP